MVALLNNKKIPRWLRWLKDAFVAAMRYAKRFMWWQEITEKKQIQNMAKYLDAANNSIQILRETGVPDDEIREIAQGLCLPIIQATMDAMIINRCMRLKKSRRAKDVIIEKPLLAHEDLESPHAPTDSQPQNEIQLQEEVQPKELTRL